MPNDEIQKFSKTLIETTLKQLEIRYLSDADGNLIALFNAATSDPVALVFGATGLNSDILHIGLEVYNSIDKDLYPRLMEICNRWNATRRWPKACLAVTGDQGSVVASMEVPLSSGVHVDLLDELIRHGISPSLEFSEWVLDEISRIGVEELM